MTNLMSINSCEISKKLYFYKDSCLAIPELWEPIDCADDVYQKQISPYVDCPTSSENHASDWLVIEDMKFFEQLEKFNYFSIFTSFPDNLDFDQKTDFHQSDIYQNIVDKLVFLGWNPWSFSGSALTDGYYPAYFDAELGISNLCHDDDAAAKLNRFYLIDDFNVCEDICRINNEHPENSDIWFCTGIYVDKHTYSAMQIV